MPLERLMLILVIVLAAAGLTVWVGTIVVSAFALPLSATLALAIPALLVVYVVWRVVAERLKNPEDDRYDRIDH